MHRRSRSVLAVLTMCCASVATSLTLVAAPADAGSKLGPSYRVKGVSDGDTIKVVVKGKTERVRLIGIDTPELGREGTADQCHARQAARQMRTLVQGKRVHLQRDTTQDNRDRYGRLLRYVYTAKGRKDVGKTLIARGDGKEYTFKKAYRHRSAHRAAERKARKAGRGLWGACEAPSAPAPAPNPTTPAAPSDSCLIKGNIANDGEKIYHVPGGRYYDVTVITPSKGERWFCSEAEAVSAGWRRSAV